MKHIGFTISDGWAFRFLFATGLYKEIVKENKVTLICSSYYHDLITKNLLGLDSGVDVVKLEFINQNKVFALIRINNFIFRDTHGFKLRKWHILKHKWVSRQFLLVVNFILQKFVNIDFLSTFLHRIKLQKPFVIKEKIDELFFLSPYLKEEVALSLCYSDDDTKLCFVLPSWDNIYKYYTFKHFDSYIVWGESQQLFLKNVLKISSPIFLKGPISQYVFNRHKAYDGYSSSSVSVRLLYCTITSRNFPNEVSFVRNLINKINSNDYGNDCHLTIRLHPADKDLDIYEKLVSKKVGLSHIKGVSSLTNWDVSDSFFPELINDFVNSDIIICVASTITLDAIMLGRPVINFKPQILKGKVDYYDFEHYRSISNSKELDIVENMNDLDSAIFRILKGDHKDYRKAISKEVQLHNSTNVLDNINIAAIH